MNPANVNPTSFTNNFNHCTDDKCTKNLKPVNISPYKWGDYIVFKPSEFSSGILKNIGVMFQDVISKNANINKSEISLYSDEQFHLTLAMPLNKLTKPQIQDLFNYIQNEDALDYELVFDDYIYGSCSGMFGSRNYSPDFGLKLTAHDHDRMTHYSMNSHNQLSSLADKIRNYCNYNNLVDLNKNSDGKCNKSQLHVTLGKIKEKDSNSFDNRVKLHNREAHRNVKDKSLVNLLMDQGKNAYPCNFNHPLDNKGKQVVHGSIPLTFEKIEVRRVEPFQDGTHQTILLGSINLKTKKQKFNVL